MLRNLYYCFLTREGCYHVPHSWGSMLFLYISNLYLPHTINRIYFDPLLSLKRNDALKACHEIWISLRLCRGTQLINPSCIMSPAQSRLCLWARESKHVCQRPCLVLFIYKKCRLFLAVKSSRWSYMKYTIIDPVKCQSTPTGWGGGERVG